MTTKGTAKPYVKFIGNSSTEVTGSCHLVRFKNYVILLDCGMVQGHDIVTDYKANMALLKKIKPKEIDWIILSHVHIDHSGLIPALYARGCQAHLIVPQGSYDFLKLLWEDSMKIFFQDCFKMSKRLIKASPYYTQDDIDNALGRIIEIPYQNNILKPPMVSIASDIWLEYYSANHIIHACQARLTFKDGSVLHRLGYTGDIGGTTSQPYVAQRYQMQFVDLLIGENTYNQPQRMNKPYDRAKDIEKIKAVVAQSNRVLIPCFSLGRTQLILSVLYQMWQMGEIPVDIKIIVDSPLAIKFCEIWPWTEYGFDLRKWDNVKFVTDWEESVALQKTNYPCIIISASGMMQGGRVMEWAKCILPGSKNTILFCGYSSENTLASHIRYGDPYVSVDGEQIMNNANIIELVSFSSHASYEELMDYYTKGPRYNKIALVHGDMKYKPEFAKTLQNKLGDNGNSAKVVRVNEDTKIYF